MKVFFLNNEIFLDNIKTDKMRASYFRQQFDIR